LAAASGEAAASSLARVSVGSPRQASTQYACWSRSITSRTGVALSIASIWVRRITAARSSVSRVNACDDSTRKPL
jgi:hypothetical protein